MKIMWKRILFFLSVFTIVIGIVPITVAAVEGMTTETVRKNGSIIIEAIQETGSVSVNYPSDMFRDEEASVVCYNENWNKDAEDLVSNFEYVVYLNQKNLSAEGGEFTFMINEDAKLETPYYLVIGVESKAESMIIEFEFHQNGSEPIEPPTEDGEVIRLYGSGRYETGYAVADALKEVLGVEKFEAVVVATGKNFADALAGSYLAVEKNAPILLTNGKDDNIAALHAYIAENVVAGAKVFILGGEGAVPAAVAALDGYDVVRLSGPSRYDTNLAILNEAGIAGDSIIVATGKTFADSLSASAAKLPILLVKPNAVLNDAQKEVLAGMKNIYIVGGESAVSAEYEAELKAFGEVTRVSGKSRYETSVEIAKTFCDDVDFAVVASGKNFPDGLCGGPLAAALAAPLVLTKDGGAEAAGTYVAENEITSGYVLGGSGALADETVVEIFALESAEEIK